MKIWDYLDLDKLEYYIDSGLVDCRWHKEFNDLMILCYAKKATFENVWDDITEKCRGLIVNFHTGDIIARPFEKFHNLNTDFRPETHYSSLPHSYPSVSEKLDGSLGILYEHKGVIAIASKGSFHSDHAQWATQWYSEHVLPPGGIWPEGYTPVFEMICESVEHHVVHYGWEALVLLALINNETGEELTNLNHWASINGLDMAKRYPISLEHAMKDNRNNEEGYVLAWPREGRTPLRVKVKFAEFLRLQKLVHAANRPMLIFEALAEGRTDDIANWIDQATPEIAKFVQDWLRRLSGEYVSVQSKAAELVKQALLNCTTRKETAAFFRNADNKRYSSVCFAMLDQHDYKRAIWKMVKELVTSERFVAVDKVFFNAA